MYELLAGLLLSLTAAVVGVWGVTRRDRPLHGPIDDGMLGLPRLQRWDTSYRPPRMQRLRSRFPRIEISRFVIVFCVIVIAVAAVGYFVTRKAEETLLTDQSFESGIAEVQELRRNAMAADDMPAAYALLVDAEAKLDSVAGLTEAGADDAQVISERSAIEGQMAELSKIHQIQNVQTIGSVPAAPAGVTARLLTGGGRVYLLSDGIYQVDVASRSLVLLLRPGDMVNNVPVEPLRAAAWREDRLMVIDARRAYIFDPTTGGWAVEPLGTFDVDGFADVSAGETFDFNLYLLSSTTGQILKFQAGLYENNPEDWTAGLARAELQQAVDMAIDRQLWVLLPDGRILTFFRSRLEATIVPNIVPPVVETNAIYTSRNSPYLYVLTGDDGRILRLSREGALVQQLVTGDGDSPISGAHDFVIDEESAIGYVLANNTIYTLRIPVAPALPADLGTPMPE